MRGLDWIIAPVALLCFALSMGVIVVWVPSPDLAIVCIVAVLLAAYDFWLSAFRSVRSRNSAAASTD
jgi:hypothetical protein